MAIACASVSERIHSSSSNCFEVGSFSVFKNIDCLLSRNRHFSSKSPVAHLIVRMLGPRNKRAFWPAPAKETMASKCSCRSPVGPGALISDSLTCGSEAIPVLFRPCSLIALGAALYRSGMRPDARTPRDQGCGPVCAALGGALRSTTHESLHGFADGSWGSQGTGSFPALLMCLFLHPSCCSARRPRALLTQDFGDQITDWPPFPTGEVKNREQRKRESNAHDRCPLMAPSRYSVQAVA